MVGSHPQQTIMSGCSTVWNHKGMAAAVCPGSFDPITLGHVDVIERACLQFDELVVAVLTNETKRYLFTAPERMTMAAEATAHLPNVRIDFSEGLLVDYATTHHLTPIVKGLRAVSDFEYELQMAQMNQQLSGIDTFFIATNPLYSFLSSSLVKEVARYGGDVSHLLPDIVHTRLLEKIASDRD